MRIQQWISESQKQLESHGIQTARLDCFLLLEHTLGVGREKILAEPDLFLSSKNLLKLTKLLNRRLEHEPMAYILGSVEFYGYNFVVNSSVLVPRPESETIIDQCKRVVTDILQSYNSDEPTLPDNYTVSIADVGCGSGALGIVAKLELPNCMVELLDIDGKALETAQINVDLFTLNISIIQSDLIQDSANYHDVLLCNLPYVPDEYVINEAAQWEPKIALFGGIDGLDLYRKLFQQINLQARKPLYILTESLPSQHKLLSDIAATIGYKLDIIDDFICIFCKLNINK
jgi:release factor glutamine methyltransferase